MHNINREKKNGDLISSCCHIWWKEYFQFETFLNFSAIKCRRIIKTTSCNKNHTKRSSTFSPLQQSNGRDSQSLQYHTAILQSIFFSYFLPISWKQVREKYKMILNESYDKSDLITLLNSIFDSALASWWVCNGNNKRRQFSIKTYSIDWNVDSDRILYQIAFFSSTHHKPIIISNHTNDCKILEKCASLCDWRRSFSLERLDKRGGKY